VPLFFLLWGRLRRAAARAIRIAARIAAGTPPSAARPRATPRPSRPTPLRLPRGHAWVVLLVPGTAGYGGQLQALLADPAMARLAEAPAMRRLLNPLRQMLGVPRPPAPDRAAPSRPPTPRPDSDNRPSGERDSGKTAPACHPPKPAAPASA
jgi:hypothetical protein